MRREKDLFPIRRQRLAELCDSKGGQKPLSDLLIGRGVKAEPSWISQVLNGHKNMGADKAREIEAALRLDPMWFDALADGVRESGNGYGMMGIPVVGTAQLGSDGYWLETAHPTGSGDGKINLPTADLNAYSLRVVGDSMHPRIKSGEYVVVEPNHAYGPGDEVLVVTRDGRSMVKEFLYRRDGLVALQSVNDGHGRLTLQEAEIEKIHYVAAIVKAALYAPA